MIMRGMVAAPQAYDAHIGAKILREGVNAFDPAVAAACVNGDVVTMINASFDPGMGRATAVMFQQDGSFSGGSDPRGVAGLEVD